MSYCLNPKCPNPSDLSNNHRDNCRHCGTELLVRGRFRVVRPLGGGGFGKTFEVDDKGTLKVLKVLYKNHPKAVELFQQEAIVLSRLQHPGIPKVDPDGYFTFLPNNFKEPLHCLVMEKIQGLNLEEWLKQRENKPLKQDEAIDCLKKLSEILEKVHQQQFFHRDIKPLNIMRRPNGQLVLIDFGAAREVTATYLAKVGQGQNVTGIVSPGYTPPEQVNGKAVPQSDFYALGRTLVYLITSQPPTAFPENPRTGKLIWREKAPQISPEFGDIIDYLMAPFPGNRPQNAQMILQCLAELESDISSGTSISGFTKPRISNSGGNSSLSSARTVGAKVASTGKNTPSAGKNRRTPEKKGNLKKRLFQFTSVLLLGVASTQAFSLWRYGQFPANPLWVLGSLPGSVHLQRSLKDSVGFVNSIAIARTSKQKSDVTIATSSLGTIRLWDVGSGNLLHSFGGLKGSVTALAITPNGKLMVSGGDDKTIRLWNLDKRFRMLTVQAHNGKVNSLAISPNGKILASGSEDKTIRLWQLPSGQRLLTITAHSAAVNALAITPDGQSLVSASDDKTLKIWNLNSGKLIRTLQGHKQEVLSVAISSDGKTLASGSKDGVIRVWDLKTGKPRKVLKSYLNAVRSIAISPDGKLLVGAGDGIKVWHLDSYKSIQNLYSHYDYVSAVAITPDGETLISASRDQTLKIWRLPEAGVEKVDK